MDKLAKQAAKQQCNFTPSLPSILNSSLPHSKSTHKTIHTKQLKENISFLFQKSPSYNKLRTINPKAPSSNYKELTTGLPWCQSSILIQLCKGNSKLNQHLYNIGAVSTPICPACKRKEEMLWHFLLSWMAYVKHWQPLINILHYDALNLLNYYPTPNVSHTPWTTLQQQDNFNLHQIPPPLHTSCFTLLFPFSPRVGH